MPRVANYFHQLEEALQESAPYGVTRVQVHREEARPGCVVAFLKDGDLFHGSIRYEDLMVAFESNLLEFLIEAFWKRPTELERGL
jgi:hypothetical protein